MNRGTKVFIAAIVIIPTVVFAATFWFSNRLHSDIDEISVMIDEIDAKMYAYGENGIAVSGDEAENLLQNWKKHSTKWGAFIDHEAIHQIDSVFAEYVTEVKIGEYDAALISSTEIKCGFEMIKAHDTLEWPNFF